MCWTHWAIFGIVRQRGGEHNLHWLISGRCWRDRRTCGRRSRGIGNWHLVRCHARPLLVRACHTMESVDVEDRLLDILTNSSFEGDLVLGGDRIGG